MPGKRSRMNRETLRNLFIGICCLIIIGLGYFAFIQYTQLTKVQYQWEAEKQNLVNLKAEIEGIERSIERYKQEKVDFEQLLFNERDVPAFLDEISKYAKQASMTIIDMKTQQFHQVYVPKEIQDSRYANMNVNTPNADQQRQEELKQAMTISAMPIQVRVKGGFASFVEFLDHLQDYKQLLNIANVEIQSTTDYPILDCQFTIRIYSLKTLAELKRK